MLACPKLPREALPNIKQVFTGAWQLLLKDCWFLGVPGAKGEVLKAISVTKEIYTDEYDLCARPEIEKLSCKVRESFTLRLTLFKSPTFTNPNYVP